MGISRDWRDEIEEKLSASGMITVKSMFGGLGFYREGLFFAVADDNTLYFKTDEVNAPAYEERGMPMFDPMGTGKPMKYHQVPDEVLNDPQELPIWIDQALGAASRKPIVKKRVPSRFRAG